jgi:hypothetical protein
MGRAWKDDEPVHRLISAVAEESQALIWSGWARRWLVARQTYNGEGTSLMPRSKRGRRSGLPIAPRDNGFSDTAAHSYMPSLAGPIIRRVADHPLPERFQSLAAESALPVTRSFVGQRGRRIEAPCALVRFHAEPPELVDSCVPPGAVGPKPALEDPASRLRSPAGRGAGCTVARTAPADPAGAATATTSMAGTPRKRGPDDSGSAREPRSSNRSSTNVMS